MYRLLFLCCLFATGCAPEPKSAGRDLRFVVVAHGQSADPFWSVVSNGVRAAARDLGVRAEYQAPARFDMVEMSNLIEAAIASRPHGLVVSIPDGAALSGALRKAASAGIPVISINSGEEVSAGLGAIAHVGQSEFDAGSAAGERMAAAGARSALCVIHEQGNAALDTRCRGFTAGFSKAGGRVTNLAVELANPDDAQQRIRSALRGDPGVDAVLTLGPVGAQAALPAIEQAGRPIRFATFDLSPEVLTALQNGRALFAIDQQQYLQGYLPIVLLTTYLETLALPGGGKLIPTGPGFVTRETAQRVSELTARGIR